MTKNAAPPGPADATGLAPESQTVASSGQTAGRTSVTMLGALPPWRGVAPYTFHLLQALDAGSEVDTEFLDFAALYPPGLYPGGEPYDHNQPRLPFKRARVRRLLAWYNPLSWLWAGMSLKGEVVHAQWWAYILAPIYATVLALARLRGRRVVLTLHNVAPHEANRAQIWMYRSVFRFAHEFIVHSRRNASALEELYPRAKGRTTVVPMGTHTVPMSGDLSQDEARTALGLPLDRPVILAFGNLRPYKGIDGLLRAFRLFLDAGQPASLIIVGQPWGDFARYQQVIEELGLGEDVHTWLEYVPEERVQSFFAAADLAVFPYTHFDAQSAAGTLALSFGLPMLVTEVGGLPDLVDDERAVVPPNDQEALANAMRAIFDDGGLRVKLAADAKRRAGELDWGSIARQTAGVYQRLTWREAPDNQANERDGREIGPPTTEPPG